MAYANNDVISSTGHDQWNSRYKTFVNDWNKSLAGGYLSDGQSIKYGDATIANTGGKLSYNDGKYSFSDISKLAETPEQSAARLAMVSPEINTTWKNQYGIDLAAGLTPSQYQYNIGVGPQSNPDAQRILSDFNFKLQTEGPESGLWVNKHRPSGQSGVDNFGRPIADSGSPNQPLGGGSTPVGGSASGGSTSGSNTASGSASLSTSTGGLLSSGSKAPTTSTVDYGTETIEGRIKNLLGTTANGAFTNPVVRQAADRAMAAFAGRGLLNSSMAQEAAMEAAIAKAIEIAGPDAERYFQNTQTNRDWINKFGMNEQEQGFNLQNAALAQQYAKELKLLDQAYQGQNIDKQYANQLQTNYLQSMMNYEDQFNKAVLAVQGSEMNQQDKAAAIQTLQIQKENNILFTTEAFSMMPNWKSDWSALTGGAGAIMEAPEGVDVAAGPANATRAQIYKAIQYAAEDPSYMTDDQFKAWAQAAVTKGLISQESYQQLVG